MFSINFFSWRTAPRFVLAIAFSLLVACSPVEADNTPQTAVSQKAEILTVYKDANCGCCKKWITHLSTQGLQSDVINHENMAVIKQKYNVAARYRSCHTAVSSQGFFFEGHIPAKFITKFLAEQHEDVIGLTVPAMPLGSPGMEMGDKFMPYQILLIKADGSHEVYAKVDSYEEQF